MNTRAATLVGLLILTAFVGTTWFITTTSKDHFDENATYTLYADFQDASGIRWKTRVQINGIDVGKIANIEHVRDAKGRLVARVALRIAKVYDIYDNATLHKASESLLGDFRLDLDPGTPEGRKLQPGEVMQHVFSSSDVEEIKSQVLQIARHINNISESFSKVLAGPEAEGSLRSILSKVENSVKAIEQTTLALRNTVSGNDQVLTRIIKNVGIISDAIVQITIAGGDMPTMVHNLAMLAQKLNATADNINHLLIDTDTGEYAATHNNLKDTLHDLHETMNRVSEIVRKVDEGQGTLGRLINDPGIAERVESTLDSANEIIGSIASVETQIELRSEYDVPFQGSNSQIQPGIKNTLGLRIMPKPDKYYIIEAIADPRGRQTRTLTSAEIGQNTTIITDETRIDYNELKFSAEFAKRYYFLTLRFGIIENTGGLGVNLHALHDKAEIRLDAYDFDRQNPENSHQTIFPRLRMTSMYRIANHVHFQMGIDDPLNKDLRTWFLGGAMRFTDEDLKAFLTLAPRP